MPHHFKYKENSQQKHFFPFPNSQVHQLNMQETSRIFSITAQLDYTSIVPSTSSSPAAADAAYYIQSPCTESHDEADKCSSCNSVTRTPTNSVTTESSRVSGPRRKWSGGKRGYRELVDEEKGYFDDGAEYYRGTSAPCRSFIILLSFGVIFTAFCLVFWAASRPYRVQVEIKSLEVYNLYYNEGSDYTGVPTKLLTVNCSASMLISNPAPFFGIHISSYPVNLMYSEIVIANGQLKKYYQPRKSKQTMRVNLLGYSVPLYGIGWELAASDESGGIPLRLEFDIHSTGYLVGNLVETKHTRRISCSLVISSKYTKVVNFDQNSCKYF